MRIAYTFFVICLLQFGCGLLPDEVIKPRPKPYSTHECVKTTNQFVFYESTQQVARQGTDKFTWMKPVQYEYTFYIHTYRACLLSGYELEVKMELNITENNAKVENETYTAQLLLETHTSPHDPGKLTITFYRFLKDQSSTWYRRLTHNPRNHKHAKITFGIQIARAPGNSYVHGEISYKWVKPKRSLTAP
jgi:hypothetical protein